MEYPLYEPPRSRLRWVADVIGGRRLLLLGVLGLAGAGLWWMQSRPGGRQALVEAVTPPSSTQIKPPVLDGYAADPVLPPPDKWQQFLDAQARLEAQRQAELDALRNSQEAMARALEAMKQQKAAPGGGTAPKRVHQDMQHQVFKKPADVLSGPKKYKLVAGKTVIPGEVVEEINSDTGDSFTCHVTTTVYDSATGQIPLVPQGSTIIGRYRGASLIYGDQRLPTVGLSLVVGEETHDLGEAPVMTQVGTAGLVSEVDNHWGRLAGAVLIQGVLRGSVQALQTVAQGGGPEAQVVVQTGQSASQAGTRVTNPWINARPTIRVHKGEGCYVRIMDTIELTQAF